MKKGAFSSLFQGSRLHDLQIAVASHAVKRVPTFLRERAGIGPWLPVDSVYSSFYLNPCTDCERDYIFTSNDNGRGETQYAFVHYRDGTLVIDIDGGKRLFNGDPLNLMDYPIEFEIRLGPDGPPPEASGLEDFWRQLYGTNAKEST